MFNRYGRTFAFLALAVIFLGGCSTKAVEWSEEVELSSKQLIIAERADRYKRVLDVGAGFQSGWLYQHGWVRATLPAPISRVVEWEGSLKPLVLDVFPGPTVYFIGTVATGAGFREWGLSDNERYVAFRLSDTGWERVALKDVPMTAKPNLLASTRHFFEPYGDVQLRERSLIDLATKKKMDSRIGLSKWLKTIVRPTDGASK